MKISIVSILIFLCSTFYNSFGTTQTASPTDNTREVNADNASLENTANTDELFLESLINKNEVDLEASLDSSDDLTKFSKIEDDSVYNQENGFLEAAQNSGVAHEITSPSLDIIHTLVDTAALELKEKAEELSVASSLPDTSHDNSSSNLDDKLLEEPSVVKDIYEAVNVDIENDFNESDNINQTEEFLNKVPSSEPKIIITDGKGNTHEEIPSFSEWTQKQLEEAERKKEEVNASVQNQSSNGKSSLSGKKRLKNYGSPDCGAKIIAANPEAISAASVLSVSRDEYKLNACTSRIWFVVELCEGIQAKKIELANFELFSSSPKDFSISVSDRFPSRDWSSVGHFTAKDERDIQSFELTPHLYSKFIKFEMHSHHGSEHYCPISLFRVFGTSEFEVLETENQVQVADDDDDDETLDSGDGVPPKNLFSSATDAVISMVKKAAEVLGNKGNHSASVKLQQNKTINQYSPLVNSCTTPSHVVVCDNCSDLLFGYVFELLSCKSKELLALVNAPVIRKILYNSDVCSSFGLDWRKIKTSSPSPDIYKNYFVAVFATKYIAAMCNTVAISECRVVLNISSNATIVPSNIENIESSKSSEIITNTTLEVSTTDPIEFASSMIQSPTSDIPVPSQIKPTKTQTLEEQLHFVDSSAAIEDDRNKHSEPVSETIQLQNGKGDEEFPEINTTAEEVNQHEMHTVIMSTDGDSVLENSEGLYEPLDSLVNEFNGDSTFTVPVTTSSPPTQQKESVFLRLSNRLKALELNMSLSGQYLEELSRRYKKQVEEMQRVLDKTINSLTEDNKRKEEQAEHLEQQIKSLKEAVESLVEERNALISALYWLVLCATVTSTLLFCRRNSVSKQATINEAKNSEILRRKSIDVVSHKIPTKKKRRPSEEALLVNGTYEDLLIDDVEVVNKSKKRKKRKQKVYKTNSVSTLFEEVCDNDKVACKTVNSDKGLYFSPKLTSSRILKKQTSPEVCLTPQSVDKSTYTHAIQDIPFVLEDSEHSSLEHFSHNSVFSNEKNNHSKQAFIVNSSSKGIVLNYNHKKSASVDGSTTPSPINTNEPSLNGTIPDDSISEPPRREKKNLLKKIFRNFSFK